MSKNNNVNPGQYKTAGRERPGEGIRHEENKEHASIDKHRLREEAQEQNSEKSTDGANGSD
jgi:hypothetical protein